MRWRNTGGQNKTHGTVEKTPRIDSFELSGVEDWGHLFAYRDRGPPLVLECCRELLYMPKSELETVTLWHPTDGWSRTIELSHKPNGYGGSQVFFLCPACGGRVRYLYMGATFLCRKCSRLNYQSQQENNAADYWYNKGMALADKYLWPLAVRPDSFTFCDWVPERPRYMHKSTYLKYLRRFAKYQRHHQVKEMADMVKILRMLK